MSGRRKLCSPGYCRHSESSSQNNLPDFTFVLLDAKGRLALSRLGHSEHVLELRPREVVASVGSALLVGPPAHILQNTSRTSSKWEGCKQVQRVRSCDVRVYMQQSDLPIRAHAWWAGAAACLSSATMGPCTHCSLQLRPGLSKKTGGRRRAPPSRVAMIRSRAFPLGNGGQQQQADFVPFQGQPRFLGERSHVFGGAAGRVSEGETGSRSLDLDTPSKIQSTVFRSSACPSACASQGS